MNLFNILGIINCVALLIIHCGALLLIKSAALLLSHCGALALHLCEALLASSCGALLAALWLREALRARVEGGPDQVAGPAGGEGGEGVGPGGGQEVQITHQVNLYIEISLDVIHAVIDYLHVHFSLCQIIFLISRIIDATEKDLFIRRKDATMHQNLPKITVPLSQHFFIKKHCIPSYIHFYLIT